MKSIRLALPLLFAAAVAFAQMAPDRVPACNSFDINGQPVYASGTMSDPNCTDYFGSGNWANSPLPHGGIVDFTLIAGGSGYVNPFVLITDPTGTGATATATQTGGVITDIRVNVSANGTGYVIPQVTIVDLGAGGTAFPDGNGGVVINATCGVAGQPDCGFGAMVTATLGGPYSGGMRKFVDPFVDLKSLIATPDQTTFAGSDYYEIAVVEYQQTMHRDLAPTTLRGYVQMNSGSTGCFSANFARPPSYLGPVIVAIKDRPVRVKFTNCLANGPGGNLFIPTDTTFMGAGMGPNGQTYTQNRATLHLHGGATPWISDGTPHQWVVPAAELSTTLTKGVSTVNVPDMFFVNGVVVPNCTTQTCAGAGATNDPGLGSMTFYWTNEQGGRLMFYHDHAYGLTRLNVYAGEAAGYLLVDPIQEDKLAAATAPGTVGSSAADLNHLIPLVIQDKSFIADAAQTAQQDPTWAQNYGTTPGAANAGDLWFPHIYIPNQNPFDPTGASAFGRWDYGPWFFPPLTNLTAAATDTFPCTSAAFPGQVIAPIPACPTCGCPITPNPSGTPESFMDTPIVNGVAYPVLHVAPEAYRFHILSAGNDRSFNLSWFVAADQNAGTGVANTEVAMVSATVHTNRDTFPLCTAVNPVAVPSLGIGLATALLDNSGNPMNGTGLPANCWPNYGPMQGMPPAQTQWAADGRAGGAPDPTKAGPPWIQIGSEGGLLPAPVVIPATPINYEQNVRSITIGSVAIHGLWLGPAERADVIVDFSKFAGQTLILYNDAPAPAPALDSRVDYYTGDGDQSPIGGAPNTPPGYGPNTRTIMQVVVDGATTAQRQFSLSSLKLAFASQPGSPALFATTQPTTIVPQPMYNTAYAKTFPNAFMGIQSTNLTFTPIAPLTFDQPPCAATSPSQCGILDRKTIQELFTLDYGRMNATLGTELPLTNFFTQTTLPYGYAEWPTEITQGGQTALWRITHNGVDSHFIHFHLFNVQVVNRVGWDGSIRPIDANEAGWKDTVRMNPLEDILVALQPITPTVPFPLPDSIRSMDVTKPDNVPDQDTQGGTMSGVDPYAGNPLGANGTINKRVNFGWEYVWHCHILGHEENDMMRPIIHQVPPPAPANLIAAAGSNSITLTFTDSSLNEDSWALQRDVDPTFSNPVTVAAFSSATRLSYGQTVTSTDNSITPGTKYYYRASATDNFTEKSPLRAGIFQTAPITSVWSNVAPVDGYPPVVTFTSAPANAVYNSSFIVTATTNAGVGASIVSSDLTSCTVSNVTTDPTFQTTATVTMASGTGQCVLTASWPVTGLFFAASRQQTTTAALASPTVTLTGMPLSAAYNSTFTVNATSSASTLQNGPTFTGTAGVCSATVIAGGTPQNTSATTTMLSGSGTCTVTAAWPADTNFLAATKSGLANATKLETTTTITSVSPNPAVTGQVLTVSFTIVSNSPIGTAAGPTGGVTVTASTGGSCTATLTNGAGSCGLTTSNPGDALLAAVYNGDSNFNTSTSAGVTEKVRTNPTISFTGAPVSAPYGNSLTVTATTNSAVAAAIAATGVCSVSNVATDANFNTTATVTMTSGTGTCSLTATWPETPTYFSATASQSTTASLATPIASLSGVPATAAYNSTFTVTASTNASMLPNITATLGVCTAAAVGGTPAAATSIITMTSGTGTCTVTATWAADSNYSGTTASGAATATMLNSTIAISSVSPNPSVAGQPVTINVTVASATTLTGGAAGPSGSVTVTASTGETCTVTTFDATGNGSCQVPFKAAGASSVTATYGGDANFKPSGPSAAVTQQVRDFSVAFKQTAITINGNQNASYTVTFTSLNNFSGTANVTCGGSYPAAYSCTVNPTSVSLTPGSSRNVTLTVRTTKGFPGTYQVTATGTFGSGLPATGGLKNVATGTLTVSN